MKDIYTTYQIARICNVDISTVINWVDSGKLVAYKTPGGHRRVRKDDFLKFLKAYQLPIPRRVFGGASQTTLIIAEDVTLQNKIKKLIQQNWPETAVLVASDAFSAGKSLAEKRPTLVILTSRIPGIDCHQACKMIRSDRRLKNTRIMVIKDTGGPRLQGGGISPDVDDCLCSEFLPDEFIQHVGKYLS